MNRKIITPADLKARQAMDFRPGDTVIVSQKIKEGDKTRLQAFEGMVLGRKHGVEPGATFTVRKVASGVGVEKIFPLYSPLIDSVKVVKKAKARRAKLYYVREKAAREIRNSMEAILVRERSAVKELAPKEAEIAEAEKPTE